MALVTNYLRMIGAGGLALTAIGCGYGVNNTVALATGAVPQIEQQPVTQTVPIGLSATFSVGATGSALHYQWAENGVNLEGATGSTYATPAATLSEAGAAFTVTVSNSVGSVKSVAASLNVTARAPLAGDLRFHQVDASSTFNGYGQEAPWTSETLSNLGVTGYSGLGTSFWVGGAAQCSAQTVTITGSCSWSYSQTPLPQTMPPLELVAGYAGGSYPELQYDLSDPNWPDNGNGSSPAASNSVALSLDIEPASQLFAVAWVQSLSGPATTFHLVQNTVSAAALPLAASTEGANGRVITALSDNGGAITYLAYGWSADAGTIYEAQVSTAAPGAAAAAAAQLAAQGYILTATGIADAAGDVVLVGTRVQGDELPRGFMTAQGANVQTMMKDGYATVGVILGSGQSNSPTYIGER